MSARSQGGFTLIELLVVLLIMSALIAMVSSPSRSESASSRLPLSTREAICVASARLCATSSSVGITPTPNKPNFMARSHPAVSRLVPAMMVSESAPMPSRAPMSVAMGMMRQPRFRERSTRPVSIARPSRPCSCSSSSYTIDGRFGAPRPIDATTQPPRRQSKLQSKFYLPLRQQATRREPLRAHSNSIAERAS